jgi:hypothetical protein
MVRQVRDCESTGQIDVNPEHLNPEPLNGCKAINLFNKIKRLAVPYRQFVVDVACYIIFLRFQVSGFGCQGVEVLNTET